MLGFDDLPPEWRQRSELNPSLGLRKHALAVEREQRRQAEGGARPPQR